MKPTKGQNIFNVFNILFFIVISMIMLIPVLSVLKESFEQGEPDLQLNLIPNEFTLMYYEMVIQDPSIYGPFFNSVMVTLVGTVSTVFINAMGAYTLSRRGLRGNRLFVYMLVVIPMVIGGGGLIAQYWLFKYLGLIDRFAVLILPFMADGWQMILIRHFYWSIPFSLTESAQMDGAQEFLVFRKIILPLSKPVLAAMALFTGIAYWNRWFNALIFMNSPGKYTFPVKLRTMVMVQQDEQFELEKMAQDLGIDLNELMVLFEHLSSTIIIVAMVPVIIIYPYLQKHFAKGIRIGAVKE